jgi:hypothetical protein
MHHGLTHVLENGIVQQCEEQGDGYLSTGHSLSEASPMIRVVG